MLAFLLHRASGLLYIISNHFWQYKESSSNEGGGTPRREEKPLVVRGDTCQECICKYGFNRGDSDCIINNTNSVLHSFYHLI